jgi:hypothetical protein
MRIALDAMGGDFAPGPIIAGALQVIKIKLIITFKANLMLIVLKYFTVPKPLGWRSLRLMACVRNLITPFLGVGNYFAKKKLMAL